MPIREFCVGGREYFSPFDPGYFARAPHYVLADTKLAYALAPSKLVESLLVLFAESVAQTWNELTRLAFKFRFN